MDWSDIGRSISAVAPTIAGVLVNMVAPGVGPLAASGVSFLLKALGVAEDLPDEQKKAEVERALASGNPDILLALKKADQEFAQAMAKLEVDLEELAVRDRESARKMKIETRDWVPGVLTVMLTAGFFGMLSLMAVHTLPAENAKAFDIMLGSLGTSWIMSITFYFGTTRNSGRKNDVIASLARGQ